MDFYIALDKDNHKLVNDGKTAQSNIIYIPKGHTALVSLYNMTTIVKLEEENGEKVLTNKSCLTIKKLSFGRTGNISALYECDKHFNLVAKAQKLLDERRVFAEPVVQDCCAWSINPCNNMALIPTPGLYILETDDIDQLNNAYVEYAILTVDEAKAIPYDFRLGN